MDDKLKSRLIIIAAIFLIAAFYFGTQFSTSRIVGEDGHFHIRFANLILERGIPQRVPELKFTIWNQNYRDYHLLFHILLTPFSVLSDITIGAKIAAAFFAFLACMSFLWALKKLDVQIVWMWILFYMVGSYSFLLREQMPRIQSLALIPLIVVVAGLCRNKYKTVFSFALLNVWLYDSFILLAVVAAVWVISRRGVCKRWELKPIYYLTAGLICGMTVNPYFPENFGSYAFNFWRSIAPAGSIPVAVEWFPYGRFYMLKDAISVIILAAIVVVASVSRTITKCDQNCSKEKKSEKLFFVLLSLVFLILYLKSRRFVEYAFPIFIFSVAVIHRDIWPNFSDRFKRIFISAGVAAILVGGCANVWTFISNNQSDEKYGCYMRAGEWIKGHVKENETIFTTDWDVFPYLYFNAPKVRYVAGLDPLFFKLYDEHLYNLYGDITMGRRHGQYADIIKNKFESNYVFSDNENMVFLKKFEEEPGVFRVFSETFCRIYRISQ